MLSSISIEGGSLQEVFSASTNEYTIDLNAFATSLNIDLSSEEGASISAILSTDPDTTEDDIQIPIVNSKLDVAIEQASTLTLVISKNNRRSATYTFNINRVEPSTSSLTQIWGVDQYNLEGYELTFGDTIDMTNNGSRIAIGIPEYSATDSNGNEIYGSGAVLILELEENGEWNTTFLESPHALEEEDFFGNAVAIQGNMLAIGATGEDGSAESTLESPNNDLNNSGAVFIYLYNENTETWVPSHYIKSVTTLSANSQLGIALDLWFNNEESAEIAITSISSSDSTEGVRRRSLEVLKRNIIEATDDAEASDTFEVLNSTFSETFFYTHNRALELSENYLVIGDSNYDSADGDSNAGRILIYQRLQDGTFSTNATIFSSNTERTYMGSSVAIDGHRIATGISGLGNGEVQIYTRTTNNNGQLDPWELSETITAPNGNGEDDFGYSVDLRKNTLLVGARDNNGGPETTLESILDPTASDFIESAGAVYVFQKNVSSDDLPSTWEVKAYIKAPDASEFDDFGSSVKIAPNGTIAASAPYGESYLADENDETGAVYVYR